MDCYNEDWDEPPPNSFSRATSATAAESARLRDRNCRFNVRSRRRRPPASEAIKEASDGRSAAILVPL
jgi:hypothetical protein